MESTISYTLTLPLPSCRTSPLQCPLENLGARKVYSQCVKTSATTATTCSNLTRATTTLGSNIVGSLDGEATSTAKPYL